MLTLSHRIRGSCLHVVSPSSCTEGGQPRVRPSPVVFPGCRRFLGPLSSRRILWGSVCSWCWDETLLVPGSPCPMHVYPIGWPTPHPFPLGSQGKRGPVSGPGPEPHRCLLAPPRSWCWDSG